MTALDRITDFTMGALTGAAIILVIVVWTGGV